MKWTLLDRGFLPTPDPLAAFPAGRFAQADELGQALPQLVFQQRFRDVAPKMLAMSISDEDLGRLTQEDDGRAAERLFMLFSYFASAYVHSPGLPPARWLPVEIAAPLSALGQICKRPPILSYASYCLHNWRRIDPKGPIALGNIELLQNFSLPGEGKSDEDWFILTHVDIEARAGQVLTAFRSLKNEEDARLETILQDALAGLKAMNRTMDRMPEGCSPEVYFRKVRPYIFGFDNIVYEGCFARTLRRCYRGETGAQSSIVPSVLSAMGIRHKDSLLTKHLDDMRNYMPAPHREFIASQGSVRDQVVTLVGTRGQTLKDLYNSCLSEVIAFRTRHFEYAVSYIQKKVDNPLATGGTPYVPWLRQLIDESKEQYL